MSPSSRAEATSLGWEGYRAFRQEDKQVDDVRRKGDGEKSSCGGQYRNFLSS